jgi:hypothetical protein
VKLSFSPQSLWVKVTRTRLREPSTSSD